MNIMSSTIVTHLIITYHPDCKSMFIFSFNLMYSDALIKSFIHTHFISLWDCSLSFDLNIDCFVVHSYHVALHSSDFFVILTSFRRLYHNNVVFALYNQQMQCFYLHLLNLCWHIGGQWLQSAVQVLFIPGCLESCTFTIYLINYASLLSMLMLKLSLSDCHLSCCSGHQ